MTLLDLMDTDDWAQMEKQLNDAYGMNSCVFDHKGARITTFVSWANELCPKIKGDPGGGKFICAAANQVLTERARRTGSPVIEECDAGFVKVAVPIIAHGEFLGTAGCCGLLPDQGEADAYLVARTTELCEAEVARLGATARRITIAEAEALAADIETRIREMTGGHAPQAKEAS